MNKKDRKSLSPPRGKLGKQPLMPQLLQVCRGFFQALEERYPKAEQSQYSLRDCQALFMATFLFKFPSLSSFLTALNKNFRTQERLPCDGVMHRVRANLRGLFGLQRAPCDTTARRLRHPDVNFVVVADALYANVPMVRLYQQLCMSYLIRVKPGKGQSGLFAYMARRGYAEARWHAPTESDRRGGRTQPSGSRNTTLLIASVPTVEWQS